MNGKSYGLLIPLLLVCALATDYCNATNTTYQMVSNIDTSQYLNLPLAIEVQASDEFGSPLSFNECQVVVYANEGKVIDLVQPIHPELVGNQLDNGIFGLFKNEKLNDEILNGRLITNEQGFMRYALTLGDKYQVDTDYAVRVDCGEGCTKQSFRVLSSTTPYFFYNMPLFFTNNPMLVVVLGVALLIALLVISSILGAAFGW
jgi:hypothetical protein